MESGNNEISFTITFLKAENLMAGDFNGKSDPYVKIISNQAGFVIPKNHKTKFISSTLNPVWNESFKLKRTLPDVDLKIEVYDHDYIGSDDFLGGGTVPLEILNSLGKDQVQELWVTLYHSEKDKKSKEYRQVAHGRVLVALKLNPKFIPGHWIPILNQQVYVGLGWDFFSKSEVFDLDASVTGFNESLQPIDYAYYSHLKAFSGAIKHKGDNLTGEGSGDDEVVSIHLNELPKSIIYLAVCVNSYRGNSMIKAKSAYIRLFDKKEEIGKFILAKTKDCIGLLLGLFSRKPGTSSWYFRVMADPLEGNFIKASIPSIQTLLTGYSLNKSATIMGNSAIGALPLSAVGKHPFPGEALFQQGGWFEVKCALTHIGLGWDFNIGETYDLDASAISFDEVNTLLDIVYHKNLQSLDKSIIHHGDNKFGFGEGDDEIMTINFPAIDVRVATIAIIVNSFKENSLTGVKNGFIRIFDQAGPIGCHIIGQGMDTVGLMLGLFRRNPQTKTWFFTVMIEPISGNQAVNSINEVKFLLNKYILPSRPVIG